MRHRLSSVMFVALCGLAPVALGNLLQWSGWLWGFMSTVTVSGSLLLVMTILSGRAPADPFEHGEPEPPAGPVEPPYQETRVIDSVLPSGTDGYDFLFSATVWWKAVPDDAGRAIDASPTIAAASVVSRAEEVVRHEKPGRVSFVRYLLDGELGVLLPDRNNRVKALATDVTLTLAPSDHERLRKLKDLRKDEEMWEYEREHERNKRRYLGDDVLKSAGSAVVWWLTRHEDEIEKAVHMIGPLAQIAAAANDEEVPDLFRHLLVSPVGAQSGVTVGGTPREEGRPGGDGFDREEEVGVPDRLRLLLTAAGLKPDMDGYKVFAHRVMRLLQAEGMGEAADEIRLSFGLAPDEEPDGETSDEADIDTPWPPPAPPSAGPLFTDMTTGKETEAGEDAFTHWAAMSSSPESNGTWWEREEGDMPSPRLGESSLGPQRPDDDRRRDEEGR